MSTDRDTAILTLLGDVMEVYDKQLTPGAMNIWLRAFAGYPVEAISAGLSSYVQSSEGRFPPKPGPVIEIMKSMDGRPTPDEAWSMIPRDESSTCIWSEEMREAWGYAQPLLEAGDQIAARKSFLSAYERSTAKARDALEPVRWSVSPGTDPSHRELAIREAVAQEKLPSVALSALPPPETGSNMLLSVDQARIGHDKTGNEYNPTSNEYNPARNVSDFLAELRAKIKQGGEHVSE